MTLSRIARMSTVVAIAAALAACGSPNPTPVASPAPVVQVAATPAPAPAVEEDDPAFNCLTMGNRVCGPDFHEFADVTGPDDVVHTGCLMRVMEPSSVVVCADGYVELS